MGFKISVVRWKEKENDSIVRREFLPKEAQKAIDFHNELKSKNYAFVEIKTDEI